MKQLMIVALAVLVGFAPANALAFGNAEKKMAKQKNAIKNWQKSRYRHGDVLQFVQKNGKLSAADIAVTCNLQEAQPLIDALLAGYVTVVNIVDSYAEIEEGNAAVGFVSKKIATGKSRADAESELSQEEKTAYDNYLEWLKKGENKGSLTITDEDLDAVLDAATTVKAHIAEIKESVSGRKGANVALAKDSVTAAKIAGSTMKGGFLLKGILDREKKAKALIEEQ